MVVLTLGHTKLHKHPRARTHPPQRDPSPGSGPGLPLLNASHVILMCNRGQTPGGARPRGFLLLRKEMLCTTPGLLPPCLLQSPQPVLRAHQLPTLVPTSGPLQLLFLLPGTLFPASTERGPRPPHAPLLHNFNSLHSSHQKSPPVWATCSHIHLCLSYGSL